MSGEHDVCPGCGAEAWCCGCVDLTDRCTTHHICGCLQAKLEAADAEVERLVLELRAIEWQGGACGRCPNCLGYEPEHKPDCTLADALEKKE